jgi:hypothetical protein
LGSHVRVGSFEGASDEDDRTIDDFLLEMIFIAHKPKKTCWIEGLDLEVLLQLC